MSRAEAATRLTRAAIALGARDGAGALSLQAIARSAGVSKALLLYHFEQKAALLDAVVTTLARGSAERLAAAAVSRDPMDAWRVLAREEAMRGELALLSALGLETDVTARVVLDGRQGRESTATQLAVAVLSGVALLPRVPPAFLGRLLLRQLDGLCVAASRAGLPPEAVDAELDAFALALLALGR